MRETNKTQLIALAVLAGLNILISNTAAGDGRTLEGERVASHSPEMLKAILTTMLFGIQLISFVLGALVAFVPYKQKEYKEKWLTFSLSIAIAIHSLALAAGVIKLIF